MAEHRVLALWPDGVAPYTEYSGGQAQPSVKEFTAPGAKGALVIVPGGGYSCKVDHEKDNIAAIFGAAGVAGYVLDYRVMPCHPETPLCDALRAIRLVRSLGYGKVGIIGFSAGGHVACSAATLYTPGAPEAADPIERLSSRPDAFVSSYSVVSFTAFRHQRSMECLLGDRKEDAALQRRFSAELNVTEDTPPGFIWHSRNDQTVPVENSLMLAAALSVKGVPYELHVFPEGRHGAGVASPDPRAAAWSGLCIAWLRSLGFCE
ncbi:MAG: alpha/beta hydrolase [Clostridia bacterium]|nr:alpha/beta hydrolase [Clostridia bacterium]